MRACLALFLLALPAAALADPWKLDPATTVTVMAPWLGGMVPIRFPKLEGAIDFDARAPGKTRGTITADATAATVGVRLVDRLLQGAGYLDGAAYPTITFEIEELRQIDISNASVTGRLTLRGVTRPVTFAAKAFRYGPDPEAPGGFAAGFDITGEVDRTEFGSTGGLPAVSAIVPVAIHLLIVPD